MAITLEDVNAALRAYCASHPPHDREAFEFQLWLHCLGSCYEHHFPSEEIPMTAKAHSSKVAKSDTSIHDASPAIAPASLTPLYCYGTHPLSNAPDGLPLVACYADPDQTLVQSVQKDGSIQTRLIPEINAFETAKLSTAPGGATVATFNSFGVLHSFLLVDVRGL